MKIKQLRNPSHHRDVASLGNFETDPSVCMKNTASLSSCNSNGDFSIALVLREGIDIIPFAPRSSFS
ncbi:MAG TPA: hypothetical protein VGL00_21750, partial [Terracidiphilus sp.]